MAPGATVTDVTVADSTVEGMSVADLVATRLTVAVADTTVADASLRPAGRARRAPWAPCPRCSRPGRPGPASRKPACSCGKNAKKAADTTQRGAGSRRRAVLREQPPRRPNRTPSGPQGCVQEELAEEQGAARAASREDVCDHSPASEAADRVPADGLRVPTVPGPPKPAPGLRRGIQTKGKIRKRARPLKRSGVSQLVQRRRLRSLVEPSAPSASIPTSPDSPSQPQARCNLVDKYTVPSPTGRKCFICPHVFKAANTKSTQWHILSHMPLGTCPDCGELSSKHTVAAHRQSSCKVETTPQN